MAGQTGRTRRRVNVDFSELEQEAEQGNDDSGDDFVAQAVSSPEPEIIDDEVESPPPKRPRLEKVKLETFTTRETSESKRLEALRDRMELFYGSGNDQLVAAVWQRIKWGSSVFVPSQQIIDDGPERETLPKVSLRVNSPHKSIGASPLPQLAIEVDETRLKPGETRQTTGIFIMNLGAAISTLKWATHIDGLLAIGLLDDTSDSPIDAPASRPSLATYSNVGCLSRIVFVELTSSLKVVKTVFTEHGPVLDMAWQPGSDTLACVFQDGKCGLISIPDEETTQVEPCLLETDNYTATCVCWRDPITLVVGMSDGSIAEFDVSGEFSGDPSWIVPVHHSVVTSLASAGPEHPSYVCSGSVDGYVRVVDTDDPRRWSVSTPRISNTARVTTWSPMAQSFIGLEDQATTKLIPLRRTSLQMTSTSLTRHLAAVSAVAASEFHPMLLSGGDDGSLHITNVLRRTMVSRRNKGVHNDGRLWTLECSELTSQFRFVENLTTEELSKAKAKGERNADLYPKACAITAIDWVPCRAKASWYAAGTASGLLRVENLST